jgi:hypothetical protein
LSGTGNSSRYCCSLHGWCGTSTDHCTACQPDFGYCPTQCDEVTSFCSLADRRLYAAQQEANAISQDANALAEQANSIAITGVVLGVFGTVLGVISGFIACRR